MTKDELYAQYSKWTGELHHYVVRELGRHIDAEFDPATWTFRIYSGYAEPETFSTVPNLSRPPGELKESLPLPTPEQNPTPEDLQKVFRILCLAAAKVLQIDLGKPRLPPPDIPIKKHASRKKRLR